MTDSIVGPMVPLIQRAVEEGHELANHCPADRSYSMHFKAGFKRALHQSEEVLRPYKRKQMGSVYLRVCMCVCVCVYVRDVRVSGC